MKQLTSFVSLLATAGAALLLITGSHSGLYGIDGNPPGPSPTIMEFTGPSQVAGGCPNGPNLFAFPTVGSAVCPGLVPFPMPFEGDVTVNSFTNLVYAADPVTIARFASNGAFIDSFPAPIQVTGMCLDPFFQPGPLLWVTDGQTYGGVIPPPIYGCMVAPPAWAVGPFPIPMGGPFFTGSVTDIDYNPVSGSLIGCDLNGFVVSFMPGAAPVLGPYGSFAVAPGACPNLQPPLTGIAFDKTLAGSGTFYVTDGIEVGYMLPGGALAPATFYTPIPCYPRSGPPISGLAFAARPITYGTGADDKGALPPRIGSSSQSVTPNPGFSVTLSGSVPGSTAFLYMGKNPLCPPLTVAMLPIYLNPTPLFLKGIVPVDLGGNAFQTVPLGVSPAKSFYFQWLVLTPGSLQVSEGMAITTSLY